MSRDNSLLTELRDMYPYYRGFGMNRRRAVGNALCWTRHWTWLGKAVRRWGE
jgi:hypothetical protein